MRIDEDDRRTEFIGSEDFDSEKTVLLMDDPDYARTELVRDGDYPGTGHSSELIQGGLKKPERTGSGKRCYRCFKELPEGVTERCPFCGNLNEAVPKVNCHLYPGTVLKDHIIIGEVEGFGGFGVTYRAWDSVLCSMVAVKEYFNSKVVRRAPGEKKVEVQRGKEDRYKLEIERFLQEAKCTAQFRACRNVVYVYDIFEENGTAYMVMEFLDGDTLQKKVRKNGGGLPWQEAVRIIDKVAEAASQLHSKSVIHRDISPDNVFVCKDGNVKLMDFGAATFPGSLETGEMIIKPGFAPPEQYIENGETGPWTDIYALSATLYYALTGIVPEESTNRTGKNDIEKVSGRVPNIPEYLDKAVTRGMDVDIRLRFKSMEQFRNALLHREKVLDSDDLIQKRKKIRGIVLAGALLSIIILGLLLAVNYSSVKGDNLQEETEVVVWVPCEENDTSAVEMYREMSSEFIRDYPKVTVKIEPVLAEDYVSKVKAAHTEAGSCTLICVSEAGDVGYAELGDVFEDLETSAYVLLTDRSIKDRVPLGYKALVGYGNEMAENTGLNASFESFLNGDAKLIVGETKDFYRVQESLPGVYSVIPLSSGDQAFCYTDTWGVAENADSNQKKAAAVLLKYWLGENAQDIMYVQNRNNLPLNKNEIEVYKNVYGELSDVLSVVPSVAVSEAEFEEKKEQLNQERERLFMP